MSSMVHSRAHIEDVIQRMTRGSAFAARASAQDEELASKCAATVSLLERAGGEVRRGGASAMAAWARHLRATADFSRIIVVVDLDAFYAGVAEALDPALRGKPFAVGDDSMLSAASYEARRYGVRSALPGFIARALCPQLLIVRSNWQKIEEASAAARAVLARYDPALSMHSVDEAALDLTEHLVAAGVLPAGGGAPSPEQLAAVGAVVARLRAEVRAACGVTASAGVAPTWTAAKIASNVNKPDGQTVVPFDGEGLAAFMAPLPLRAVPGVGRVTEARLRALGIHTCTDAVAGAGNVRVAFGERTAKWLLGAALGGGGGGGGSDGGEEEAAAGRRSLSRETTFDPTADRAAHRATLSELCGDVAEGLVQEGLVAARIVLRVKTAGFAVGEHGAPLRRPTAAADALAAAARALLDAHAPSSEFLRLLGVRAEKLAAVAASAEAAMMAAWVAGDARKRGAGGCGAGGGGGDGSAPAGGSAAELDDDILEIWSQEDGAASAAAPSPVRGGGGAARQQGGAAAPSPAAATRQGVMAAFLKRGAAEAAEAASGQDIEDVTPVEAAAAGKRARTLDCYFGAR
jgi:DNA polymerase kappa